MKISELIEELRKAQAELGDIDVTVDDDGCRRPPSTREFDKPEVFCLDADGALWL